jgi:hypothetical protein
VWVAESGRTTAGLLFVGDSLRLCECMLGDGYEANLKSVYVHPLVSIGLRTVFFFFSLK